MKLSTKKKFECLLSYPFFQVVGEALPPSVTPISSWPAAAKMCRSKKWATCQLMARNALQGAIEARYPEGIQFWHRMQEWNPLSDELRPLILSFVDDLLSKFPLKGNTLKNVRDALSWDLMAICIEHEFRDLVKPFFYIPVVEPWYAAGHFPCGWDGDEFPNNWDQTIRGGQLMVF